jgi:NAD(P)-dependent dehydrogenase (short-subunit alcohol dehydrogenase family)
MGRVLVFGCDPGWTDRLAAELAARDADLYATFDRGEALATLDEGVDAVVTALEPCPRSSGLSMLLAARDRHPSARRVLVVPRRASVTEAALETGLVHRVVASAIAHMRIDLLADWLTVIAPQSGTYARPPFASLIRTA